MWAHKMRFQSLHFLRHLDEFCMPPNCLWVLRSGLWRSCVTNVKHGDSTPADRSLILYERMCRNLARWVEIHLFWQGKMIINHCWVPLHMVTHLLASSCHCGISFSIMQQSKVSNPILSQGCPPITVTKNVVGPMLHAYPDYKYFIYVYIYIS